MRYNFFSPKPRRLGPTLYDQLHARLRNELHRRIWAILLIVLWALVIGLLFLVLQAALLPLIESIYLSLVTSTLLVFILIFGNYAARNTNRSEEEGKHISTAFDFLYEGNIVSRAELNTLDRRAEIGMNAGQIRTLFPLLLLPLVIPITIQIVQILFVPDSSVSVYSLIYLGVGLILVILVLFSFFHEIERSNRDAIIRHAIAEYTNPKNFQALQEQRDKETVNRILKMPRQSTRKQL